jgi:hypothetical protein
VLKAGPQWEVLRINAMDDECKATPAIETNKMWVRTRSALYCFASSK